MKEEPLFMRLVRWLWKLISVLCAVFASPVHFYVLATEKLVCASLFQETTFGKVQVLAYALLWFPRWLACTIAIPLFFAAPLALSLVAFIISDSEGLKWFLAVAFFLTGMAALLYGLYKLDRWLKKLNPEYKKFLGQFGQAQLDFLAFLCTLFAVATVVRIPHFWWLSNQHAHRHRKGGLPSRRQQLYLHLPFALLDLLILPFTVVFASHRHWVTRPGSNPFLSIIPQPELYSFGLELRKHILVQFYQLIIDTIAFAFAMLMWITPHRLLWALPKDLLKCRQRYRQVHPNHPEEWPWWISQWTKLFLVQFGESVGDVVAYVGFWFVLLSGYRVPFVWRKTREIINSQRTFPEKWEAFRDVILEHGWGVVVDFPYLLLFLLCFVSVSRTYFVVTDVWRASTGDQRREAVVDNGKRLWQDVLDLPFYILGFLTLINPYRTIVLLRDVATVERSTGRLLTAVAVLRCFLDIFAAPLATAIVALSLPALLLKPFGWSSGWRANSLYQRIKTLSEDLIDIEWEFEQSMGLAAREDAADRHKAAEKANRLLQTEERKQPVGKIQEIIFQEFLFLLVDLPFVFLGALISLNCFRLEYMLEELRNATNDWQRRMIVFRHFLLALLDMPALAVLLALTFTHRGPVVWGKLQRSASNISRHKIIFVQAFKFLVDLPFLALALLALWRIPQIVYYLSSDHRLLLSGLLGVRLSGQQLADIHAGAYRYRITTNMRRLAIAKVTLETLKDIPCSIFCALMLIFPWRAWQLGRRLYNRWLYMSDSLKLEHAEPVQGYEEHKEESVDDKAALVNEAEEDLDNRVSARYMVDATRDVEHSVHLIILEQFVLFLLDIPAGVALAIICGTVWRGWFTVTRLINRRKVLVNFRSIPDWKEQNAIRADASYSVHMTILYEFGHWLLDIPVVALLLATSFGFWRHLPLFNVKGLPRMLKRRESKLIHNRSYSEWYGELRTFILGSVALVVGDILATAASAMSLCSWRLFTFVHLMQMSRDSCHHAEEPKFRWNTRTWYLAAFVSFVHIILDLIHVALAAVVVASIFQFPSFARRMWKMARVVAEVTRQWPVATRRAAEYRAAHPEMNEVSVVVAEEVKDEDTGNAPVVTAVTYRGNSQFATVRQTTSTSPGAVVVAHELDYTPGPHEYTAFTEETKVSAEDPNSSLVVTATTTTIPRHINTPAAGGKPGAGRGPRFTTVRQTTSTSPGAVVVAHELDYTPGPHEYTAFTEEAKVPAGDPSSNLAVTATTTTIPRHVQPQVPTAPPAVLQQTHPYVPFKADQLSAHLWLSSPPDDAKAGHVHKHQVYLKVGDLKSDIRFGFRDAFADHDSTSCGTIRMFHHVSDHFIVFPACMTQHGVVPSLSLFYSIILDEFRRSFVTGFPYYLRFPLKLVTRTAAMLLVFYAQMSTLWAGCYLPKSKQKFSAKEATSFFSFLGMIHALQMLLAPGMLILHIILLLLPYGIASMTVSAPCSGQPCLNQLFDHRWDNIILDTPWWVWIIQGLWCFAMAQTWWVYFKIVRTHVVLYHPIKATKWLVYRILTKKLWKYYKGVFMSMVGWCYDHRRTCFVLGEIIYMIVAVIWSCWPASIPLIYALVHGERVNWIAFSLLLIPTIFLVTRARKFTDRVWGEQELGTPAFQLSHVNIEFPGYGIRLRLKGTKPPQFSFSQAKLQLGPESFWKALYGILRLPIRTGMRLFRSTALPAELVPRYVDPTAFPKDASEFDTVVELETSGEGVSAKLSPYLLNKRLRYLRDRAGNPTIQLIIRYTQYEKKDGVSAKGLLVVFETTPKDMMEAAASGANLANPEDQERWNGLGPNAPPDTDPRHRIEEEKKHDA